MVDQTEIGSCATSRKIKTGGVSTPLSLRANLHGARRAQRTKDDSSVWVALYCAHKGKGKA